MWILVVLTFHTGGHVVGYRSCMSEMRLKYRGIICGLTILIYYQNNWIDSRTYMELIFHSSITLCCLSHTTGHNNSTGKRLQNPQPWRKDANGKRTRACNVWIAFGVHVCCCCFYAPENMLPWLCCMCTLFGCIRNRCKYFVQKRKTRNILPVVLTITQNTVPCASDPTAVLSFFFLTEKYDDPSGLLFDNHVHVGTNKFLSFIRILGRPMETPTSTGRYAQLWCYFL